jgi:monoamine oxidase
MNEPIDFAIVGGGASGLYTAWRLARASGAEVAGIRERIGGAGPLKIAVFEHSYRVGGRLLSATPQALPNNVMELGGMRFLSNQPLVSALVRDELKMGTVEQNVDRPENLAYFRAKPLKQKDLCGPKATPPYNLTAAEQAVLAGLDPEKGSPAQLIFWAVYQQFPDLDPANKRFPANLTDYLMQQEVDGRPLYQWGFWNLLSRHLSHEGRQLAITAIGYDVLGANANAVDIIAENFNFTDDTKYYLLENGYESVLWRLAVQFRKSGGEICFNHTLDGFDTDDKGEHTLFFHDKADVRARAVVLALPQSALLRLRQMGPLFKRENRDMQVLLNAVSAIPLYKLFLVYERPWWTETGVTEGRSLTDLPVRQCYYWYTDPAGGPSAVMVYNDLDSTNFWGGYQVGALGPGETQQWDSPGTPPPEGSSEQDLRRHNWEMHKAPADMVEEMHRELQEMHGVGDAPAPIEAAYMDWMNFPFGGAVHFWNPGYKSREVTHKMTQPVEGVTAYIVGEAYSNSQTWVEGALETSEYLLQNRLGMSAPPKAGA